MSTGALNALAQASSSYLRSAMHQPINWHEWGEETLALAARENKPILLDIGAVWCHWCHVMDRESYDNPEVARIINEFFIAIKVDRDERPDVDSRYQAAVQAISGQGGWPLTAFLTPDGKPFYGGTYFPLDDQRGRPGLRRLLLAIAQAYKEKHGEIIESAESVMKAISHAEAFASSAGQLDPQIVEKVVESAKSMYDPDNGGFGSAPKFPHPSAMDLLIDQYARTDDPALREIIVTTLGRMARGGIYDQLAGGFHRYSTDEYWTVPHFEKMSYDNSELLKNYVHAYQATGIRFFADVARDVLRWMNEWLSDREHGGFYASQDADYSLDDDGDYFTWTLDETRAALNDEELHLAALHYDINEIGEMHHNPSKNVLFVRASIEEISKRTGIDAERVRELLGSARKKMYAARLQRPAPYVDKTIYVNWNAMCISAYLEAARVFDLDEPRHFALRSLDRILSEAWTSERGMAHVIAYSDPNTGTRSIPGMLDDYAFATIACLDAYDTTADMSYFHFAQRIADAMLERFFDKAAGGFFDTDTSIPGAQTTIGALAASRKPFQDSPTPAGNPAAAIALLKLFSYTNDSNYRQKAKQTLETFAGTAAQFGISAATYSMAVINFAYSHTQVVVVGNDEIAENLYKTALQRFALNTSVLRLRDSEAAPQYLPPAIVDTVPNLPAVKEGKSCAVVCSDFTCQPPVSDAEALGRLLQPVIVGR